MFSFHIDEGTKLIVECINHLSKTSPYWCSIWMIIPLPIFFLQRRNEMYTIYLYPGASGKRECGDEQPREGKNSSEKLDHVSAHPDGCTYAWNILIIVSLYSLAQETPPMIIIVWLLPKRQEQIYIHLRLGTDYRPKKQWHRV